MFIPTRRLGFARAAFAIAAFSATLPGALCVRAQEGANDGTPAPQEPIVPDRPDFTNGVETVPVGRIQVEGGATYTRSGTARQISIGELLVRVPTGRKSELRLGVPSYVHDRDTGTSASGLTDASLGAKFTLSAAKKNLPATALLLNASLPTGSRRVSEHTYQVQTTLALGWDFSDTTGLGVNLGYGRLTDGGQRFDQLFASASLGFTLSEKLGGFAEIYGFNKIDASGQSARYFDTGLSYAVNPDFALDARIGFGLSNHVGGSDYFSGLGASRRF